MHNLKDVSVLADQEMIPLVIDVDGTLIRSDLLIESAFAFVGAKPWRIGELFRLLLSGKAGLKAGIAAEVALDVRLLPYDERVLALVAEARREGRPVYLASAGHQRYIEEIAKHLKMDGWFASDGETNLSSHAKAERLAEAFGEGKFDYIGNDRADLAIWKIARRRIAVHPSASVQRELAAMGGEVETIAPKSGQARRWLKLFRVHQWTKNALVFVPLLTSHSLSPASIAVTMLAFIAFSLAASSIYVLNDLIDLEADRQHSTKKLRPLAAGTVPILPAIVAAFGMGVAALLLAIAIAPLFAAVLVGYIVLTTAYSFFLKRKMLVDVVALAMLYTVRVIGGAAAIAVPVSEWLLIFSMLIFTSLALIKRYIELASRLDARLPDMKNRNYLKSDLDIVAALAAASGFNAVTIFALYVSSPAVSQLYSRPQVLWLICPILMYWIARALLMAHRRHMNDDPIVFAMRDKNSLFAAASIIAIMLVAT